MAIGGIPPGSSGSGGTPPTLADALAGLKTGDIITARVQQAIANGARLAIGRAVIDVLTQVALKPGTTVALQVQRSNSGVTLQVVQPDGGQASQQTTAQAPRPLPTVAQQPQTSLSPQGTAQPSQPQPPAASQPAAQSTSPATAAQQTVTVQAAQTGSPAQAATANPPQTPTSSGSPTAAQPGVQTQAPPAATSQPQQPAQPGNQAQTGTPAPSNPAPAASAGAGRIAATPVQVTVVASPAGGQPSPQTSVTTPLTQPAAAGNTPPQAPAPPTSQAPQPAGQGAPATASSATTSSNAAQPQSAAPLQQTSHAQQVQQVQAVATARVQAASAQTGLAPLFSNLEAALNQPNRPRLEPSVEAAARQLLGLKTSSETLSEPGRLQGALRASGPYLEATLARGQPPPEDDLKGALLALRNVLKNVLGETAAKVPATGGQPHPPPEQGSNPQAQRPVPPTLPAGADASEILRQLASDADGALARVRLLQIASLPDADGAPRQDGAPETQPRVWQMELPIGNGRETSVMAIRIERDRRARKGERDGPVWRVRLALELEDAGAVSAAIAYAPPQVSVALWAEQPETSQILKDNAGLLDDALRAAELDVDGIDVQTGHAPDVKRTRKPQSAGGLLDLEG